MKKLCLKNTQIIAIIALITALFSFLLTMTVSAEEALITLNGTSAQSDSPNVQIDGSIVTIAKSGKYTVTGTLDDGQLVVNPADDQDVTVILKNLTIHNSTGAAFAALEGKTVEIVLSDDSVNTFTDGTDYVFPDAETDEPNAAVYSKPDLVISGNGTLNITGAYNDGLSSKDTLTIKGGTINVTAADDGIRGKDGLTIDGGTITVDAQDDGLKADEEDNAEKGWIKINGGTITVSAGDDAIKAETTLDINGGTIEILTSYEGLEAYDININDGEIRVASTDDSINVAGSSSTETANGSLGGWGGGGMDGTPGGQLTVNGGTLMITTINGDSLDANGNLVVNGGLILVNGTTSNGNGAMDVDGVFQINGGTMLVAGSSGMAISPDSSSTQNTVMITMNGGVSGNPIQISNAETGESLMVFVPTTDWSTLYLSSPELVTGQTYNVSLGGSVSGDEVFGYYPNGEVSGSAVAESWTQSTTVTTVGSDGGWGGFGGPGNPPGNPSSGRGGFGESSNPLNHSSDGWGGHQGPGRR